MSSKKTTTAKDQPTLSAEETAELGMILDRLAVQTPGGESFEVYLQSLRNSLRARPILAAALLDSLSRSPSPTGFRTFEALERVVEASPFKKSAKKAAYRFAQKGFTASENRSAPEKIILIKEEQRKPLAHLFQLQGAMWIVSALIPEASSGGYSLITAFLEDDFSAFNVRVVESTGQKRYKEYLQMLSAHSSQRAAQIPLHHAARLFFEMLDFWTGKGSYAHLERAREILKRYRNTEAKPYVHDLLAPLEDPEQFFSEVDIETLTKDMDLSWLRFDKNELAPWREKLKQLDGAILVVPREVLAQRSLALISEAGDMLCSKGKRLLFTRFFEEQAMTFKLAGDEQKAHRAWIVATALAGGSPAGKNPAVSKMVMDSLHHYWPEDFPEPGKPLENQHRTQSGIILP
jgi:hypothetical protein